MSRIRGIAVATALLATIAVATALLATIASTFSVRPHRIAYSDQAVGGLENGRSHSACTADRAPVNRTNARILARQLLDCTAEPSIMHHYFFSAEVRKTYPERTPPMRAQVQEMFAAYN